MPDDLQIHVTTTADLAAIQTTKTAMTEISAATKELGGNAAPTDAALAKVNDTLAKVNPAGLKQATETSNEFRQSLARVTAEVPGLQGAISVFDTIGGKMGAVAAAAGLLAGGIALAKKSLTEFGAEQEKVFGLDATLATKGILSDEFRTRLQRLSQEMQDLTKIDSGVFIDAIQRLVTAGADSSNIETLLNGVVNLAGATGRDIPEASALLQKAMQGNFDMLGRVGLRFEKTGDQARDLNTLLELVADRGAGVLAAKGESLNGTVRGLGLAFGDLFKAMGNDISQSFNLSQAIGFLTDVVRELGSGLPDTIGKLEGLDNKYVETGRTAAESAADQKEFEESLQAIKAASDEATAALGRQMSAMEDLNRFNKDMIDANLKVDLAKLDARKGTMSGVDYETERARLIASAENQKFERDRQLAEEKVRAAQEEADRRRKDVTDLDEGADAQEARIKRAEDLAERERALVERRRDLDAKNREATERLQRDQDRAQDRGLTATEQNEARYDIPRAQAEIDTVKRQRAAVQAELDALKKERQAEGIGSTTDETRELDQIKERLRIAEEKLAEAERRAGDVAAKEGTAINRQGQLLGRQREADQVGVSSRVASERDKEREQRANDAIERARGAVDASKRQGISVDETAWVDKVIETLRDVGLQFSDLTSKQLAEVEQRQNQLIDAKLAAAKASIKADYEQKLKFSRR